MILKKLIEKARDYLAENVYIAIVIVPIWC